MSDAIATPAPRTTRLEGCPVCMSKATKFLFTLRDRFHGVAGDYGYHKCISCGAIFQNPVVVPADLHLCYPDEYSPYNYDPDAVGVISDSVKEARTWRERIRAGVIGCVWGRSADGYTGAIAKALSQFRFLRERAFHGLVIDECLPRNQKAGTALDIGCGTGWFLERLGRVGWNVDGVEWDKNAAKAAANKNGGRVWVGDFRELELRKNSYDLIVLRHVFEHLHDPVAAVDRLYELLSDEGRVVLIFPNIESLDARWYGVDWVAWEAPRHLVFPSRVGMRQLFAGSRFERMTASTRTDPFYWKESKALQNPAKGDLNFFEKSIAALQSLLSYSGMDVGSELIVVLRK